MPGIGSLFLRLHPVRHVFLRMLQRFNRHTDVGSQRLIAATIAIIGADSLGQRLMIFLKQALGAL
jgi:hypothetical protein